MNADGLPVGPANRRLDAATALAGAGFVAGDRGDGRKEHVGVDEAVAEWRRLLVGDRGRFPATGERPGAFGIVDPARFATMLAEAARGGGASSASAHGLAAHAFRDIVLLVTHDDGGSPVGVAALKAFSPEDEGRTLAGLLGPTGDPSFEPPAATRAPRPFWSGLGPGWAAGMDVEGDALGFRGAVTDVRVTSRDHRVANGALVVLAGIDDEGEFSHARAEWRGAGGEHGETRGRDEVVMAFLLATHRPRGHAWRRKGAWRGRRGDWSIERATFVAAPCATTPSSTTLGASVDVRRAWMGRERLMRHLEGIGAPREVLAAAAAGSSGAGKE